MGLYLLGCGRKEIPHLSEEIEEGLMDYLQRCKGKITGILEHIAIPFLVLEGQGTVTGIHRSGTGAVVVVVGVGGAAEKLWSLVEGY